MKQPGLIYRVINYVGLDNGMAKGKYKPAGYIPLVNNSDSVPDSVIFNYSSVVLMMIYIYGHTRPDIEFTFNFFLNVHVLFQELS